MNGGAPERRLARLDALQGGCAHPLDELPVAVIADERKILADDPRRVGEVPVKVTMDARMIEVRERRIETANRSTEAFEQCRRARACLGQRSAGEVGDDTDELGAAGGRDDRLAREGRHDARAEPRAPRHVLHRRILRLEHRAILGRIRDLQHVAVA